MAAVFVSYRRDDTRDYAARVYAVLREHFGPEAIFMDTSSVDDGADWAQRIEGELEVAKVMLVVIGPQWLSLRRDGQKRIDQEDDWVRQELHRALVRGIPILPIVEHEADIPAKSDLPEQIRESLAARAIEVRSGQYLPDDCTRVVQWVGLHTGLPVRNVVRRRWRLVAVAVSLVVGVVLVTRMAPGPQVTLSMQDIPQGELCPDPTLPQACLVVPAFQVAHTELRQDQWEALRTENPSLPEIGRGPDLPVNNITWGEAVAFANDLSLSLGLEPCYTSDQGRWVKVSRRCMGYRLLSNVEWDYLEGNPAPEASCELGNLADQSFFHQQPDKVTLFQQRFPGYTPVPCDDGVALLEAVGSRKADRWGLYDRGGNVAEWIWHSDPDQSPGGAVRGDSYLGPGGGPRPPPEDHLPASYKDGAIGVRFARDGKQP